MQETSKANKYLSGSPPPLDMQGPPKEDGYLPIREWGEKYGVVYNLAGGKLRSGILSGKRLYMWGKNKTWQLRWFVLDLPPEEHPNWVDGTKLRRKETKPIKRKKHAVNAAMKRYLDNFIAKAPPEQSRFNQKEVAQYIGSNAGKVVSFSRDHIVGFGTLPKLDVPSEAQGKYNGRNLEFYFTRTDIVRFFRGDYKDKKTKHKTLDDAMVKHDALQEISDGGFFVYSKSTVYPATFDGLMQWIADNIKRKDKKTGKWITHTPGKKHDSSET